MVIASTHSVVILVANIVESWADIAVVDRLVGLVYTALYNCGFWLFYWWIF
jgi:hypothetical protein